MEANGLDKFLPKSIAAKRRRRKQGSIAETTSSNDEAGTGGADGAGRGGASSRASSVSANPAPTRGRSVVSHEHTAGTANNLENNSHVDEAEETSLISYDSDPDL